MVSILNIFFLDGAKRIDHDLSYRLHEFSVRFGRSYLYTRKEKLTSHL